MKHDSKPLTVDQMREMHDKVVIVKTLEYGQESKGILDFSDPNDSDNGVYVGCEFYSVESYGFFWLAYAQKPIGFDKWTPCERCKGCGNCVYFLYDDDEFPCNRCLRESTSNNPYPKFNPVGFCKFCGRPLTSAVQKLLENRLAGRNKERNNEQ